MPCTSLVLASYAAYHTLLDLESSSAPVLSCTIVISFLDSNQLVTYELQKILKACLCPMHNCGTFAFRDVLAEVYRGWLFLHKYQLTIVSSTFKIGKFNLLLALMSVWFAVCPAWADFQACSLLDKAINIYQSRSKRRLADYRKLFTLLNHHRKPPAIV